MLLYSKGQFCQRPLWRNERTATDHDLPPDFFARLIWRESRFRPDALSYKGAQGIAQFMPGTAKLRGLQDSYDVLEGVAEVGGVSR